MPLTFGRLKIPEVFVVKATVFEDNRGCFAEVFKKSELANEGIRTSFVQDNYSHSVKGVLRGLHYQLDPRAQSKFVYAVNGEIFDVAVDLRRNSPTYGGWVGVTLSSDAWTGVFIPEGFAHGFCVLSEEADVVYKVSREYVPELERGVRWDDRRLGIAWPCRNPVLSARDAALPSLEAAENNFQFKKRPRRGKAR
ncbi:MAG: dTDP-4-dehydrorhamnose 3,5-epimerase [Nitrososphaerota archaeon]|nr:dTDP-4-dehydrorhamnose 3,5-epimerase [Nitrososphaerota archaeon]